MTVLDEHDEAFYAEAFMLAEAVRRFLARNTTQRVIDVGLLDEDVVRDLVDSADRMWSIRTQRVGAARGIPATPAADMCSTCKGSGVGPSYIGYQDLAPACAACDGKGTAPPTPAEEDTP